jgi:hypothetical protein
MLDEMVGQMRRPIITLLADFGDEYVAAMKGRILGINPDANIIDLCQTSPHNIKEGAFLLRSIVPYFPDGTVHIGVVDPGVGTKRRAIMIESDQFFIGPDNGLLIPAARRLGDFDVYEIYPMETSYTFHGRDIFAPIAAHISKGGRPSAFGKKVDDFIDIETESFEMKGDRISGEVLHIDSFGNVITSIPYRSVSEVLKYGDELVLSGEKMKFSRTYGDVNVNKPLTLMGSHGNIEVAMNQGDASRFFGIDVGDKITLKLHDIRPSIH